VADMSPDEFLVHLDDKLQRLLHKVEQCEPYRVIVDPKTPPALIKAIIKSIMLEVFSYVPHVTEATFTAIGRMPKNRIDLMKPMIQHDLEEVPHGEMALADYVKLGGDEAWARKRRPGPAALVMAATVRLLGERENPFGYLGYMYPFEVMTPTLTTRVQEVLAAKGFPKAAQRFIDVHAVMDVDHAEDIKKLVAKVVRDFPDAATAIDVAFDCFAQVYPVPIWDEALQHARAEVEQP
jgi:hypothetical protein